MAFKNTPLSFRKLAQLVFWACLALLTILFLIPTKFLTSEIFDWWDKLQHSLAFLVLTMLGFVAYAYNNRKNLITVVLGIALYGALIECVQAIFGWRSGEFTDWLADILGILAAWILFSILNQIRTLFRF